MNKEYSCHFKIIEEDTQKLQELQKQLKQDGYAVIFNNGVFSIYFDPKKLEKRRSRGAGRKHKTTGKTMRDMYLYRQDHSQKQAAEMLGVSLRTYQRMEKSAKDAGFWDDTATAADTPFERIDAN